jgi:pilus assembly protein CpaE
MYQINSVVFDADAANREEMCGFLTQFGLQVMGQFPALDPLPAILSRPDAPHLVVINLDPAASETFAKIAHLPRQYPNVNFFVLSEKLDPHLLMEAMHAGVKEFIPLPISEEKFATALERIAQTHGMGKRARIIHIVPSIGGCGSTTVACNVAASLARNGRTALVDLDLIRGGVANSFDARPRYTIADVMESADNVDRQMLDNALTLHAGSGVALLARPELPEDTQRINPAGMQRLLSVMSRAFDYVVVDSIMSIDPVYSTTIQKSDINVIVMQLNVQSAKNAERFVGALRRMGVESSKIRIVVNRYVKKGWDIDPEEVEKALGLKIAWLVPNDFKNAIAAINYGDPVVLRAPRAEISSSLCGLAGLLNGHKNN